jgi:hypothetical protein
MNASPGRDCGIDDRADRETMAELGFSDVTQNSTMPSRIATSVVTFRTYDLRMHLSPEHIILGLLELACRLKRQAHHRFEPHAAKEESGRLSHRGKTGRLYGNLFASPR